MKLNLREIIEIPGGSVPFAQELDTALLDFPSVRAYTAPITAEGKVVNTAGILTLQGKLHAEMLCVCDRCGAEFPRTVDLDLHAEVGDHQAGLFRAQVAAFQLIEQARFALGRASGTLLLDFLDAPALPAGQLAFGHEGSAE